MNMEDDITIARYEVGKIVNDNRSIVAITNDEETANNYYIAERDKSIDSNSHIIVFIYDYDKNTNINYFDNDDGVY